MTNCALDAFKLERPYLCCIRNKTDFYKYTGQKRTETCLTLNVIVTVWVPAVMVIKPRWQLLMKNYCDFLASDCYVFCANVNIGISVEIRLESV